MNGTQQQSADTTLRRKILIVCAEEIMRDGLAGIINRSPDFAICGWAATVGNAISAVKTQRPDAALVVVTIDGSAGLDAIKALRAMYATLPIVASIHDEPLLAKQSIRAGANGFVVDTDLMASLRRILGSPSITARPLGNKPS